ncbi:hypothetical protein AVEN_200312-1 [Araneus ventricosus]|uniref:Transposable element P transposase-like RNase H domain-containing protein n=1 Tax=Araneus ventricosus TaxID=182803 RepID=A0A4Y2M4H8_ARAVE|nr:hypothetical protein AVEN_200312-1 [Araneus ventricosus]
MVWAAFGFNGQVGLAFLGGRQNYPKYTETLENHLMPFAENIGRRNWEYQHDIYSYNVSKAPGFCSNLVKCLKTQSSRTSESEKLCVLSIDEMAIKPGYIYAADLDCVDGFTTFKQDYKENHHMQPWHLCSGHEE